MLNYRVCTNKMYYVQLGKKELMLKHNYASILLKQLEITHFKVAYITLGFVFIITKTKWFLCCPTENI